MTGALTTAGELFLDFWPIIAVILGLGIAFAVYELLTKSTPIDDGLDE